MGQGIYTLNEVRELENLPPVAGGDKNRLSLNNANAEIIDDYQLSRARSESKPPEE